MTNIVKLNAAEFGLEETKAAQIASQFQPMLDKMVELEGEYNAIVELAKDGVTEQICAEAKKLRLKYVKVRTGTAEIHKQQKAFYLAGGRYVDGWKNAQAFASQGIEDKLESIEKHFERIEAERIAALTAARAEECLKYGVDVATVNVGLMSDDVYSNFIAGAKVSYEMKIEAERKAEEDRIAREKAEAEERERIRLENERLHKEAEEREAQIAKERKEAEEKLAAERAAAEEERKRIEQEEAEKRRIVEEAQRKEREENERKLAAERAERERVEAELRAKQEAEKRAEAERLAAIEAEANKGDADKVKDLISDLNSISSKYQFKSKRNIKMYSDVQTLIAKVVSHIEGYETSK